MDFVIKIMDYVLNIMDYVIKIMDLVLNIMHYVLKHDVLWYYSNPKFKCYVAIAGYIGFLTLYISFVTTMPSKSTDNSVSQQRHNSQPRNMWPWSKCDLI